MWNTIKNLFNHERYQTIAILISTMLLLWCYACESKVTSLKSPDRQVTRKELRAELDYLLAEADYRFDKLDQIDAFKQTVFEHMLLWSQTGTINPMGVIASLLAVLGVGATVDNVRKRADLKTEKTKNAGTNE